MRFDIPLFFFDCGGGVNHTHRCLRCVLSHPQGGDFFLAVTDFGWEVVSFFFLKMETPLGWQDPDPPLIYCQWGCSGLPTKCQNAPSGISLRLTPQILGSFCSFFFAPESAQNGISDRFGGIFFMPGLCPPVRTGPFWPPFEWVVSTCLDLRYPPTPTFVSSPGKTPPPRVSIYICISFLSQASTAARPTHHPPLPSGPGPTGGRRPRPPPPPPRLRQPGPARHGGGPPRRGLHTGYGPAAPLLVCRPARDLRRRNPKGEGLEFLVEVGKSIAEPPVLASPATPIGVVGIFFSAFTCREYR